MLKIRRLFDRRRPELRDSGYVLAMTALIILPLLAFTAFAIDLGAWYARAAQIQRAADAAALAGVAHITSADADDPIDAALAVAEQNGFKDGENGVTVSAVPLPGDRMQVRIVDDSIPQYFTTLFRPEGVEVARQSVAEYVPPIRMGSPRNFLGTGTLSRSVSGLPAGAHQEEFFLAISGPCDRGEDGDLRQTGRLGNNAPGTGENYCSAGFSNPEYRAVGYTYGVSVPVGYTGGSIAIDVFDAPFCKTGIGNHDFPIYTDRSLAADYTTTFRLWAPGAEVTASGSGWSQQREMTSSDCGARAGRWYQNFFTIGSPQPGKTYTIQVQSSNHSPNIRMAGANVFSLRARTGTNFQACSSDKFESDPFLRQASTGVARQNCPNIFALEDLSVFAGSDASQAEFFLASIGPEHSGRTLVIELFDPGEGGNTLQVTDPNGNLVGPGNMIGDGFGNSEVGVTSFQRSVRQRLFGAAGTGPAEVTPGGGWGPFTEHTVDIAYPGPAAGTGRATESAPVRCPTRHGHTGPSCRYNERALRLEIQLPDNIHAAYGGKTWWRIKYTFDTGKKVTDRSTWSASVEGGPVRLIE